MTALEITLTALLLYSVYCNWRQWIRECVIKHAFIMNSDWCADKIKELVGDATRGITNEVMNRDVPPERPEDCIPYGISNAKSELEKQRNHSQSVLSRNGVAPLVEADVVFGFSRFFK